MIFKPLATYRIQFHKDFTFTDLLPKVGYLASLGIDTIYASPIFTSRPGSTHGYDVTNADRLDPEIGTMEDFEKLQQELKKFGMKWLQDIVPTTWLFTNRTAGSARFLKKGNTPNTTNSRYKLEPPKPEIYRQSNGSFFRCAAGKSASCRRYFGGL